MSNTAAVFVGKLIGGIAVAILFTTFFMWLTNKIGHPKNYTLRIILANALSLAAYTIAMGYSLVPDLTIGEPPHLLAAFQLGAPPQLLCLAYGLMQMSKKQNTAVM